MTRGTRITFALALALTTLATACGGSDGPSGPGEVDGPGTGTPGETPGAGMVPDEVVGTWYTGTVSSINFFTPSTGHWDNAGGTGMFYTLKPDGTFEYGWRLYSQLYGCAMTVLVYRKGTITSEPAQGALVLHTTYARMHSEDNCNESGNYDKPIEKEDETLFYELGQDDYGYEVLWMRGPDTEPSAFHREDFD
jgi:hypothetical protein